MKLAIALSLVSTLAYADAPKYACKVPSGKISVTFNAESTLDELAVWVMSMTCKNVVFDAQKSATKLKVMAPKDMTAAQAVQLFVDSVAVAGLTATVKADSIIVTGKPDCVASAPAAPPDADAELDKLIDTAITSVDDTHKKVKAALVDKVFANPMGIGKGARVVPAMKDGKAQGFKLYAIRPNSLFAKLGLANGDTVVEVNGFELTSADKALEVYTKLREAKAIELSLIRRGQPLKIYISVD